MMIQKFNTIYVLCPQLTKTGGTELLHQLVYQLNLLGGNATIAYIKDRNMSLSITNGFDNYVKSFVDADDIVDDKKNAVVIPETFPSLIKKFKYATTFFWWLSVDNFVYTHTGIRGVIQSRGIIAGILCSAKRKVEHRLYDDRAIIYEADYHLCQSYYAMDFLKKIGIKDNVLFLSDYINDIYIDGYNNIDYSRKKNYVLYNPKKGVAFTNQIIKSTPSVKWVPLINLSTSQVQALMAQSKVYIDFGNFPGKDRFPREAAMSGCCIITGKRGAANYYQDFPISERYKFDCSRKNIKKISLCIEDCINNYTVNIDRFKKYCSVIINEKKDFQKNVQTVFFVNT